jgi:aryl-alcohol dehydrogenase-like predicted oxidoreductase
VNPPTDFRDRVSLGRSGLRVCPLGLGSSYGVSRESCLRAFDEGVNYFFWGSVRTEGMAHAIQQLAPTHRDELIVVLQCYARFPWLLSGSVQKGLKTLGLQQADVLLLGWHDRIPKERLLMAAEQMRSRGLFRHLALSTHHRPLVAELCRNTAFDVFHLRYNAVHPGAEEDVFPHLPDQARPGIVSFTNTCWGRLLDPARMPPGQAVARATDCYRFALSNPKVDVAVCGPKTDEELSCALSALDEGPLDEEEMARIRLVGRYVRDNKTLRDRLDPLA